MNSLIWAAASGFLLLLAAAIIAMGWFFVKNYNRVGMDAFDTMTYWLGAWQDEDWRKMYDYSQRTWRSKHSPNELSGFIPIFGYRVVDVNVLGPCLADIRYDVELEDGNWQRYTARMVKEIGIQKPRENGIWGVNPISALRRVQ